MFSDGYKPFTNPSSRALTALSEFLEDSFHETPQQRQSRQLEEKLAAKEHMMMIKINDLVGLAILLQF